jgi:hypothetical protein
MKTSTFENGTTTLTRVGRALLAVLAALAIGATGCDGGREGDYCVISLSHNDCNSGLVCTVVQFVDNAGRTFSCGEAHCCPASGTSTDPYCNGTNEMPTTDQAGNVLSGSVCPLTAEAGPPEAAAEGGGDGSMSDVAMTDTPATDATMTTDAPASSDAPTSSDATSPEASSDASLDVSLDMSLDVASDVKAQ